VPEVEDYNELDSEMKDLWEHKTQYQRKEEHTAEDFTVEREYGLNLEKSRVSLSAIL
jgi:hypothetical protein